MACLSRSPSHASTTCGSSTHSGHNNACFGGLSTPPPPKTASALAARSDALHRYNGSIDDDQRCGGSCSASRSMRQVRWRKGGGYGVPCSPVLGVGVAGRGCRPRSSRRQPPPPHARDVRDTDARALVDALGVPRVEFGAAQLKIKTSRFGRCFCAISISEKRRVSWKKVPLMARLKPTGPSYTWV